MSTNKPDRASHVFSGFLRSNWPAIFIVGLTLAGPSSGCSYLGVNRKPDKAKSIERVVETARENTSREKPKTSAQEKVRFDGGLLLGNTDEVAYRPNELAMLLAEMIEAKKWTSARQQIANYPDVVVRILLREGGGLSKSQLTSIAKLFDEKWGSSGSERWQKFVSKSFRSPQAVEFFQERSNFLQLVSNNSPDAALDLALVNRFKDIDEIVAAEAHRLEGIAFLMRERFAESIDHLSQAASIQMDQAPYQASKTLLLLGETQRHAKLLADWKSTWEKAVDLHSQLVAEKRVKDPSFWTKAAFLRPVSTNWPTTAVTRIRKFLASHSLHFGSDSVADQEAIVWAAIGIQSLQRHESQNAILALKKSEALAVGNQIKIELQLKQALAMIDGGQIGPASAILLRIGSTASTNGDRAKAVLATLKLRQGSLAQGMNLLQAAIKTSGQWPAMERLKARADYGLSYLMLGKETQGVHLLQEVHNEFLANHEYEQAATCLNNLATYFETTDQNSKYRQTISQLKQLESF